MDKIRDIKKYISTVEKYNSFFKQHYYHSIIDLNLIKLEYILQYGILSKKLIELNKLPSIYTHSSYDFDSKNGDMFVSLSEYTDNCQFNALFESFTLHTLTSLSLIINKHIDVSKEGARQTYFDDEIFCFGSIDKSKIEGIMLPEHLSNLMIKEVNCLPNDLSCYTRSYLNKLLRCTEEYFKEQIPSFYIEELKVSYEQFWNIIEEYESPEKWIESAIKIQRKKYGKDLKDVLGEISQYLWSLKYGLVNPKYLDIIQRINQQNLPIYEIKEKCLKKIN
ncbi:MAG: hypothetical protein E7165_00345 [Firmicutes bacterium]|nr:hypothetical protein [Bacillota bacterium]